MTTKIERSETTGIKVTGIDGDYCMSRSVEANVLFAILEKLEEIRCGLIDIETNIDSHQGVLDLERRLWKTLKTIWKREFK